jgi:hypothetical protein
MLLRFFMPYPNWVIFMYVLSAVLVSYTIAATIVKIFICNPIHAYWYGINATHGRCLEQVKVFIGDTSMSVITDLVILLLPSILILKLTMSLRKKVKVIIVLAAGGLVCVVTIIRLIWVIIYQQSTDKTWTIKRTDTITCAEITFGIIFACLPAINLLFSNICGFVHENYMSSRRSSKQSSTPLVTTRSSRQSSTPLVTTRSHTAEGNLPEIKTGEV